MAIVEAKIPTLLEEIGTQRAAVDEKAGLDWLAKARRESLARFRELGIPTTDIEEWRSTSMARLAEHPWNEAPMAEKVPGSAIDALLDTDGAAALANHAELVRSHLGSRANIAAHHFTALNGATWQNGAFVQVDGGVTAEHPILVVYLSSSKEAVYAATRNLFVFGPNSEARIVEFHASVDGTSAHFNNIVTEAIVGRDARIDHYRVQNENTASTHVAALYVQQDKSSLFRSHSFDFGAAISRHTIMALLEGQASEAILNGLYMPKGTQHHDTWMWVEHCQENIPSHELYKGILQDEGSATFTGRIYVHPEAQKTDAKQTNQNLLLSDSARVNTKPQLEIYADDVKCTHGATVGQLDMQSLFYLMSRGVSRDAARELLVLAFASEVTEGIRDERLRGRVQVILQSRLRA
jgi:Fe-S cluster assembly protein SufD